MRTWISHTVLSRRAFGRLAIGGAAATALGGAASRARAMPIAVPVDVVELFTSQGCSSCPPADELVLRNKDAEDVLYLSLHVDYWDYLGWRDTFGSPENSARQRAYAEVRGDRQVYTPQAVINGAVHVVGSDQTAIRSALISAREERRPDVGISVAAQGDMLQVRIENGALLPFGSGTLWLASYAPEETVAVERGENRGRVLSYAHVVHKLKPVADWDGGDLTVAIPMADIEAKDRKCALILQRGDRNRPGPVVTAVRVVT